MVYASDGSLIVWPWSDSDPRQRVADPLIYADVGAVVAAGWIVD